MDELGTKYQISKRFSRLWLENQRLLLFLDGLDEVSTAHRQTCVEAINEYLQEIGVPGIAICSRLAEYIELPRYLRLRGAVCLQPLTFEQINDYLVKAGPQLAALHTIIQNDPILQELAQTPLMLSVMTLAYKGFPGKVFEPRKAQYPWRATQPPL